LESAARRANAHFLGAFVEAVREFLNTGKGRWVTYAAVGLAAIALLLAMRRSFGDSEAVSVSSERPFICAKTGKSFTYTMKAGDSVPVMSPFSKERTGFRAERCTWTKDGMIKHDPTYVLLNETIGQPGPTFCPDCDRLVVGRNPPALPGARPPPLRSEFKPR
jgi:hypothetical protein